MQTALVGALCRVELPATLRPRCTVSLLGIIRCAIAVSPYLHDGIDPEGPAWRPGFLVYLPLTGETRHVEASAVTVTSLPGDPLLRRPRPASSWPQFGEDWPR